MKKLGKTALLIAAISFCASMAFGADAKANWLPAPEGQFALIVRAYVPNEAILDNSYKLPNVERQ